MSCSACGRTCIDGSERGSSLDEFGKWDSEVFLVLIVVGSIGFALGAAITGTVMLFTFNRNSKRAAEKKASTKIAPEGDDLGLHPERSDTTVVNQLMDEADAAQKSYEMEQRRRKSVAGEAVSARLAIRKAQLELKVKASKSLENVPLFKDLDNDQMQSLIKEMKLKVFNDGDTICTEGDVATNFFIVASVEGEDGCVIVKGRQNNNDDSYQPQDEVELKRLGEFAHMGEAALVKGGLRSASCYASGRIEMLALTRRKWKSLIKDGVLNEHMRESLSKKAEEYSKEAETRREPEVGGEADFDLNTLGGDGAEASHGLDAIDNLEGDDGGMTFDLTADDGDSDDGVINI